MWITRLAVLALFTLPVLAQKQTAVPTRPTAREITQTVQAIQGTWLGKMTANVPGFPSETFGWTMNCSVIAQGAGALCTNTGKASIGSMAESCLLAFDPEGKAVHYMCVTSMGEVHDHKGHWKDNQTIEFEPLRAGMMGQTITETLWWHFPDARTIEKVSEVRLADGSSMRFEFNGERQ
jgi:hypothetical protein